MSLLVVGLSHRSAPVELLERACLDRAGAVTLAGAAVTQEDVSEAVVVSTCNRIEVYAESHTFHGALAQLGGRLAAVTGVALEELTEHLHVYYDERAVTHLFSLACGLESMALGESEILGQLRAALALAQEHGHAGAVLNPLFQQALRVGKRARAQTPIEAVGRSLVGLGLDRAADHLGPLPGLRAIVLGAGAMSGLATATLTRRGVTDVTVVNRTRERADRLARSYQAHAADWNDLGDLVGDVDLLVSCTGATGRVVELPLVRAAREDRGSTAPLAVVDLAMPRDVDPDVATLPGVRVWSLADLGEGGDAWSGQERIGVVVDEVQALVASGVAAYRTQRRGQELAPTLAALRARAAGVVEAEADRLEQRVSLGETDRAEVRQALRRVVDKLLHTPTVRAKELTGEVVPGDYGQVLRELFDLGPRETTAVTPPPREGIA